MSLKIFVVEDDPNYSLLLTYRLNKNGHENIKRYESGEDCIKNIRLKPDLVLLDFSLKGLNGLDTLIQIKESSPRSRVIILTNVDNEEVAKECRQAGAIDFLPKEEDSILKIIDFTNKASRKKNFSRIIRILLVLIALIVLTLIIRK